MPILLASPLLNAMPSWLNAWVNELSQYEPILYFDWDTFINLLEKEPLALTAVVIAFLNIIFTLLFKASDAMKEARREAQQRAVLHIEAHPYMSIDTSQAALQIVLTNTGKEPLVIRDVGYQKRPLALRLLHNLSPIRIPALYKPFDRAVMTNDLPDVRWPVVIHPREFFEFQIQGESLKRLQKPQHRFTVRDSLGNLWLYRGASIARYIQRNKLVSAPSAPSEPTSFDATSQLLSSTNTLAIDLESDIIHDHAMSDSHLSDSDYATSKS